jgi:dTDP-4-amino-4,6-dideoxygalactose transaminase
MTQKKIEFGSLDIGNLARKHLQDVCDANWASYGPKCKQFEREWNHLFGHNHSLSTSSGTDAVIQACLSLYGLGAQRQDEIIAPALSFIATANAIRAADFKPVFCDINRETLNIDPSKIEEKITSRTRAIMVVHTMGRPCDMDHILAIAKKHNLIVIEDACEAHGAVYKGRRIGTLGDVSCFSFYIAHLICCGEGGMVSTKRKDIYDIIYSTRCHGRSGLYFDHPLYGLNSKMNDMEASLGLEGLANFHTTWNKRRYNVSYLYGAMIYHTDKVWLSEEEPTDFNCPHAFSITLKDEGKLHLLTDELDQADIHWKRNFGCIPTQHKAFEYLGHKLGDFTEAEYVGNNGIHIGVHQFLSGPDLSYIVNTLDKALHKI